MSPHTTYLFSYKYVVSIKTIYICSYSIPNDVSILTKSCCTSTSKALVGSSTMRANISFFSIEKDTESTTCMYDWINDLLLLRKFHLLLHRF